MTAPSTTPTWRLVLRLVVFVVVALVLVGNPFAVQILKVKNTRYLHGWRLYSTHGAGICDVRYERVLPGGERSPVYRHELMDQPNWRAVPDPQKRVVSKRGGPRSDAARMCSRARAKFGDDVVLVVNSRCSEPRGWKVVDDDRVACKPGPSIAGPRLRSTKRAGKTAPAPQGGVR